MDLAIRAPRLPQPGETLNGHGFLTLPGGKGANQAVAAARLGSSVDMVGRVGADNFGQQLLHSLQEQNVHTENIAIDASTHSGIAMITVAESGENQIVLAAGANGKVDGHDVARLMPLLQNSTVLLLQLEIPIPTVIAAAQAAQAVNAIDTTAAGDAFNGAFAAALDQGKSWENALQWGVGAGAIAATQLGAQPSLPNRESLLRFLRDLDL